MQAAGFLPDKPNSARDLLERVEQADVNNPPVPGARLGRDEEGNPAWFITDPERPGKHMRLEIK